MPSSLSKEEKEEQWKTMVNDEWKAIVDLSSERIVTHFGVQFQRFMPRNELKANIILEFCPGTQARGVGVEREKGALGALLVRSWCAPGVLLVCSWCAPGALLAHSGSQV